MSSPTNLSNTLNGEVDELFEAVLKGQRYIQLHARVPRAVQVPTSL
jgi:hypothetical protein